LTLLASGCLAPASPAAASPRLAFLDADMTLSAAPPLQASVVHAGSFFAAWAQGKDDPTWREAPQPHGRVVDALSLHLRVQVTGPVAKTFRFPDLLAYGGSGDAWMALGNASAPPVLAPGQVYVFDLDLTPPTGGLWIPSGQPLGVKVVPVMHQNDAADVEIVLGGSDPTALRWSERAAPDAIPATLRGADDGTVEGSAYAGAATPPTASHRTVVALDRPPSTLAAWLNTTQHAGIPDLDLAVVAPDGRQIAYSGTPLPDEALLLGPSNLVGPGRYGLDVIDYGSAAASFTVEWRAG
jgi:hypothetical protein